MFRKPFITIDDARNQARRRLPWMVFDYIDGAAGDGFAEARNMRALRDLVLQPRVLNNVEHRSLSVDVFGEKSVLPFGVSPMGMCNLTGPESDHALARLGAKFNLPVGVSTAASTSLEEMAKASEGRAWFQLYFSGSEDAAGQLISRAKGAGYKTLVLTVDVPEVGKRPRELKRGFKAPLKIGPSQFIDLAFHPRWSVSALLNGAPKLANFGGSFGAFDRTTSRAGADWSLFSRIRDQWSGNLVVKGVLDARDAKKLQSLGADAVQVSSHGGRQLNSAPPPIECVREIRNAVGPDFPLFFDSGIRSGEDIVKAYTSGADFVFLGRPLLFALAAQGEAGLRQLCEMLNSEVSTTLAQLGVRSISDLNRECLGRTRTI